jgi:hypothetical protein
MKKKYEIRTGSSKMKSIRSAKGCVRQYRIQNQETKQKIQMNLIHGMRWNRGGCHNRCQFTGRQVEGISAGQRQALNRLTMEISNPHDRMCC